MPLIEAAERSPSAVDRIAERWLDTEIRLDPVLGTRVGRTGGDGADAGDGLGDYSPTGVAARSEAAADTLAEIRPAQPVDAVDAVTKRELVERLELARARSEARLELRDLNVIESPPQLIRQAFDLMPKRGEADWAAISRRLVAVPAALGGYLETLALGIATGASPARRQVLAVADQADRFATTAFARLLDEAPTTLPDSLRRDLGAASRRASAAYARLASGLRARIAPEAPDRDAVGRDHYALATREFLGATIDPDECYEWGLAELDRVVAEQERTAREIVPGGSVSEAIAALSADPRRILHGTDALQRWLQERSDRSIDELNGRAFDIPEPLRRLECRIAPTQEGGISYTAPSDDFSRPGRMWWSVPAGVDSFHSWRELTTVHHEGVPGHHLQMGGAVAARSELNAWRRTRAGTSGHFEGWALYAERLMGELGFLDDPGDRLGMLDAQRMRAARVVLDIGVHLGKRRPDGGGVWDAGFALEFMTGNVTMSPASVRFEVLRYLGWPGQAISYRVGQRVWERLRSEAASREGAEFSLPDFHSRALRLGSLGLDTFAWAMDRGRDRPGGHIHDFRLRGDSGKVCEVEKSTCAPSSAG